MYIKRLDYTSEELETIINCILIPKLRQYERVANLHILVEELRNYRKAALLKPIRDKLLKRKSNDE